MITEHQAYLLDAHRDASKERQLEHGKRQAIPTLPNVEPPHEPVLIPSDVEPSVSLELLIVISAGRIEALADLVHGREPNEERAFARSTIRDLWRPVFGLAYREQLGLSGEVQP